MGIIAYYYSGFGLDDEEKLWGMDSGNGCLTLGMYLMPLTCTL